MVGSSALMAITLALLAATIKYKKELLEDYDPKIVNLLPLVEMILYILFFGLGVGTVPWLLLGELCPVKVKGMWWCIVSNLWKFTALKKFREINLHLFFFRFHIRSCGMCMFWDHIFIGENISICS